MDISMEELAREVTAKIREEIEALKIMAFGEVVTVTAGANGSYQATVILAGTESETVPLDVLGDYIPASGHWVLLIYPQRKGKEKPLPFIVDQFKRAL
jgi:hypothetical protein